MENAVDLVNAGVVLQVTPNVRDAAEFITHHPTAVQSAKDIATTVLTSKPITQGQFPNSEPAKERLRRQIHNVREKLKFQPRNTILQAELARLYTAVGQNEAALQRMRIAYNLAPSNRYILRSYARLLVHCDDLPTAKDILSNIDGRDPWLLAARLSVLQLIGSSPRDLKQERALLTSSTSDAQITELAAAMATLEFESGSLKKAKKIIPRAQSYPTDNSVAQLRWLSRQFSLSFDTRLLDVPLSYEARVRHHYWSSDNHEKAIQECQSWVYDEPFSAYPTSLGCYIAAEHLRDFDMALHFAEAGVLANPRDPLLQNNLAFTFAMLGRLEEASGALAGARSIATEEFRRIYLQATEGAIAFRQRRFVEGRAFYLSAIREAHKLKDVNTAARATIHALAEQVAVSPSLAPKLERIRLIFDTTYKVRGPDLFSRWVRNPNKRNSAQDPSSDAEISGWANELFEAAQNSSVSRL